jgi:hypothetical protein
VTSARIISTVTVAKDVIRYSLFSYELYVQDYLSRLSRHIRHQVHAALSFAIIHGVRLEVWVPERVGRSAGRSAGRTQSYLHSRCDAVVVFTVTGHGTTLCHVVVDSVLAQAWSRE